MSVIQVICRGCPGGGDVFHKEFNLNHCLHACSITWHNPGITASRIIFSTFHRTRSVIKSKYQKHSYVGQNKQNLCLCDMDHVSEETEKCEVVFFFLVIKALSVHSQIYVIKIILESLVFTFKTTLVKKASCMLMTILSYTIYYVFLGFF